MLLNFGSNPFHIRIIHLPSKQQLLHLCLILFPVSCHCHSTPLLISLHRLFLDLLLLRSLSDLFVLILIIGTINPLLSLCCYLTRHCVWYLTQTLFHHSGHTVTLVILLSQRNTSSCLHQQGMSKSNFLLMLQSAVDTSLFSPSFFSRCRRRFCYYINTLLLLYARDAILPVIYHFSSRQSYSSSVVLPTRI